MSAGEVRGRGTGHPGQTRRRDPRGGFTLLEALVAFTVLSLFFGTLAHGLVTMRASEIASRGMIEAEAVARTLLNGPVPQSVQVPGRIMGELDGRRWLIVTEALDLALPAPKKRQATEGEAPRPATSPFLPLRVTISVLAGDNRQVKIETVRLVPRRGQ